MDSQIMWESNLKNEACGISTKSNKTDFYLNSESREFAKIISNLYEWINLYDPDITFEMDLKQPDLINYGISEESLRLFIKKKFFPQLKEYCNKS